MEPLENIFRAILLLSNDGTELPPSAGSNVHPAPFPTLRDLDEWVFTQNNTSSQRPAVVFFGTPFLLVHNLPPAVYREHLNACLQALRRWYGADCELLYRPHPAETTEREQLDLTDFQIAKDRQVAELFFLQHFHRIQAVLSVSSTVSRVALNYGLNAYTLWRCFPFDDTASEYFTTLMGHVPSEFDVHSLGAPPVAYAAKTEQPTAFRKVVQSVLRL